MNNFTKIGEALKYIDEHLEEPVNLELLSEKFYFSAFYFHRLFTAVVGKSLAAYIRDRRILYACKMLSSGDDTILNIALNCGFHSAQAFSRTFGDVQGISPSEYRKQGYQPEIISAEELVMRFTNRLRGGMLLNPNIIKQGRILIAGTCGDGSKTWDVWNAFEALSAEKPLKNAVSGHGYEVRMYEGDLCTVYVGHAVSNKEVDKAYTILELPSGRYASFEIYVSNGYESENNAMDEWLDTNEEGYAEKLLDGKNYCVEYYDERFSGGNSGSIVEIWIPIEKKKSRSSMI